MIIRIKTSRILHFFVLLSACIFSVTPTHAQCDPGQKYDKIISAYHQSIALKSNGTYAAWGEAVASNAGDHLSPVDITVANGYAALGSATPLKATVGGDNDSQSILLTSNGLYTWGYSAKILDASLATVVSSKNSFQKIQTPIGGDAATGLPVGVAPADVTMLFSTFQTLAIVANGNVWVLTQTSTNLLGDGTSGTISANDKKTWHKVKINASTYLTNVISVRGQVTSATVNALMAQTSTGEVYVWGTTTYLGNGSVFSARNYATSMTLPSEFSNTNKPKMIGVTLGSTANSFYVLSNSGALYGLGNNAKKQLGNFTTTEAKSWVQAKINASTNFANVSFISVQEHTNQFAGVAVILTTGDLYTWGTNGGLMLGRTTDGTDYDPGVPGGFATGFDKAVSTELGGHTLVYLKEGSDRFCYVGHRTQGSMGDGTSTSTNESVFNCLATPQLSICGSVPVVASPTTSTISASPASIVADGITTSTITIQLIDASGNNLTTSGGVVVVTTSDGTLGTVVDNNDGTYTVVLTSSTNAVTANIGFSINGTTATNTTTVTFTAQSGGDTTPPVITGPADGVGGTTTGLNSDKSIPENTTVVYTLTASEPVTWSITGGADQSKLSINPATGAVSFNTAPDYELPTDADGNNTYIVIITATDVAGNVSTQTLTVTVTDEYEPCNIILYNNITITGYGDDRIAINMNNDFSIGTQESLVGKYISVLGSDYQLLSNWTAFDGTWYYFRTSPNPSFGWVSSTSVMFKCSSNPVIIGPDNNLSPNSTATNVAENTTAVYTFTADESVTWSITGGADQSKLSINPATGAVSFNTAPDYELPTDADGNNTYIVIITATDVAGNVSTQTLTVTVTDVVENLAPTNITLSKMNVFEANAIGAVIGNLTTTDPDVGDTHTYTLVSGAGSTSNAYFTISGNQLKAGVIFSYIAQSTYSIRIRTTDAGGLSFEKVFTITISESPTVKGTGYNIATGITPATSNPVISKGYFSNLTVTGTNLVSYSWTPVLNLSSTNTANPTASPSQTTTYAVTVTNSFGSSTVLNITVTVVEDYNVTPRNAITPNGDGKNDTWVVANITSYPNNQVRIFDRAGRLLFVESNYQNGWDGTVNGVPLKEDTYYFIITFGPGVNPKKGFISIIR